jgi:transposase, IS5 family
MSRPRDDRQDDLFRPALRDVINLRHTLVRLAEEVDWGFLHQRFSASVRSVASDRASRPCRRD